MFHMCLLDLRSVIIYSPKQPLWKLRRDPFDLGLSQLWTVSLMCPGMWRRFGATCLLNPHFFYYESGGNKLLRNGDTCYQTVLSYVLENGNTEFQANCAVVTLVSIARIHGLCDYFAGSGRAVIFLTKFPYIKIFVFLLMLGTDCATFAAIVNVSLKATIYAHCSHSNFVFFPFLRFFILIFFSFFLLLLRSVTFLAAPLNYSAHDDDAQVFFQLWQECLFSDRTIWNKVIETHNNIYWSNLFELQCCVLFSISESIFSI